MSERTIEQAIQAAGANGAPRVTPAGIEANIASEHYFTARDGRKTMSKQLAPHQQRVVDEKRELDERREKLDAFYSNPVFHGLPESEQSLLLRQGVAMRTYSEILGERIAAF